MNVGWYTSDINNELITQVYNVHYSIGLGIDRTHKNKKRINRELH